MLCLILNVHVTVPLRRGQALIVGCSACLFVCWLAEICANLPSIRKFRHEIIEFPVVFLNSETLEAGSMGSGPIMRLRISQQLAET